MISMIPRITDAGENLILRGICGERITFTRFGIGDGTVGQPTETALIHERINFPINSIEETDKRGVMKIDGRFNNTNVDESFRWTELGVFARGESQVSFNGNGSTRTFTVSSKPVLINEVFVNGLPVVVDSYNSSTGVVTLHTAPAAGTANVTVFYPSTNEILYAYVNCGADGGVVATSDSGVALDQYVTLAVAVGAAENITAIISETAIYATKTEFEAHKNNQSNPHNVQFSQISGVLPVNKGGTGMTSLDELRTQIGNNFVVGFYSGNSGVKRLINLGFKPKFVLIADQTGMMGDDIKGTCGGVLTETFPLLAYGQDSQQGSGWNNSYYAAMIADNGFYVSYGTKIATNTSGRKYVYVAVR